jgi:potassium-transporting ATPase ATP-binding subunit
MDIDGVSYRKGAVNAIQKYVQQLGRQIPGDLKEKAIE